jgi:signal transduction histidine kinase
MQFITDNTRFLESAFADLHPLLGIYRELLAAAETGAVTPAMLAAVRSAQETASLDYLLSEIPKSIGETLDGVKRTTKIVRAMKTFSHPGCSEKTFVDLREAVESTLTISRSEWHHVSEVVTDFDPELPLVLLFAAEFNQALLNLIVNAAHAIADVVGKTGKTKGAITISIHPVGAWVEVRIRDTGTGIPEAVQHRVFDPFFTTKPLGQGTGQGLAIARSVIVGQHGGSLEFESTVGQGTVFIIRTPLQSTTPIDQPDPANRAA